MTAVAPTSATASAGERGDAAAPRASLAARVAHDFFRTPPAATEALLAVEAVPLHVWEPACGDGAISRVLLAHGRQVISSDLVDRGVGETGRDFLATRHLLAPAIVTNPPFKLADRFVLHALDLGSSYVAMFLRLAFLEGRARHEALWRNHPPARIWVFSRRLTLWRGDDPNPRETGGTIAFAWFIWDGPSTTPTLGWIA